MNTNIIKTAILFLSIALFTSACDFGIGPIFDAKTRKDNNGDVVGFYKAQPDSKTASSNEVEVNDNSAAIERSDEADHQE